MKVKKEDNKSEWLRWQRQVIREEYVSKEDIEGVKRKTKYKRNRYI